MLPGLHAAVYSLMISYKPQKPSQNIWIYTEVKYRATLFTWLGEFWRQMFELSFIYLNVWVRHISQIFHCKKCFMQLNCMTLCRSTTQNHKKIHLKFVAVTSLTSMNTFATLSFDVSNVANCDCLWAQMQHWRLAQQWRDELIWLGFSLEQTHLPVDDCVDAHQCVILVTAVKLYAILSRRSTIQAWVAACWKTALQLFPSEAFKDT